MQHSVHREHSRLNVCAGNVAHHGGKNWGKATLQQPMILATIVDLVVHIFVARQRAKSTCPCTLRIAAIGNR
jgi:hypothetical protein